MIFTLLAQASDDSIKGIFGEGIKDAPLAGGSISQKFSDLFGFALNLVMFIAAMYVLIMLVWGALDWIKSEGDKTKLQNAQAKITNAFVGVFVLVFVLVLWLFTTTSILGTLERKDGKINFELPSVDSIGKDSGGTTLPSKIFATPTQKLLPK